jgi:hypothetical protein
MTGMGKEQRFPGLEGEFLLPQLPKLNIACLWTTTQNLPSIGTQDRDSNISASASPYQLRISIDLIREGYMKSALLKRVVTSKRILRTRILEEDHSVNSGFEFHAIAFKDLLSGASTEQSDLVSLWEQKLGGGNPS